MDTRFPILEICISYIEPSTSNFSNRHLQTIYITFEHEWVGVVSSDSSTMELVIPHCGAIVLNSTGPISSLCPIVLF
jgi:hypothetical protein